MESRAGDTITKQIADDRIDTLIVDGLAEATDRQPLDVPPLYDSVDLDALSTIVLDGSVDVQVEFEHIGCTVQVADGEIAVTPN